VVLAENLELTELGMVEYQARLPAPINWAGIVMTATNVPVFGARVHLRGPCTGFFTTDSFGRFSQRGVLPGNYSVMLAPPSGYRFEADRAGQPRSPVLAITDLGTVEITASTAVPEDNTWPPKISGLPVLKFREWGLYGSGVPELGEWESWDDDA
jgi:hypothetical protein